MNFDQYLERINYKGALKSDIHTLRSLTNAHLMTVPFEDLDIQYHIPIVLDTQRFFDKIVVRRRGGYCYEVNGLFYHLLGHLGFDVTMISGRVAKGQQYGREFDHLALLVRLDGQQWLVDVGYGDFSFTPLSLSIEETQHDGRTGYRLKNKVLEGVTYMSVEKFNELAQLWNTEYYFTTIPRQLEDFMLMNAFQQTNPSSHFVQNLICTLPTHTGRISILNNRFIITENNTREENRISPDQLADILSSHFNISLLISDSGRRISD